MSDKKEIVMSAIIGAGAGALVGFGVWWYAQSRIESGFDAGLQQMASEMGVGSAELRRQLTEGSAQLRAEMASQVEIQVRPAVRDEIRRTLASYNITAETGRRLNQLLVAGERLNLL